MARYEKSAGELLLTQTESRVQWWVLLNVDNNNNKIHDRIDNKWAGCSQSETEVKSLTKFLAK